LRKVAVTILFLSLVAGSLPLSTAAAATICEVQAYDPGTGLSPLTGQRVTVTGVVTVPPGIFVPAYTSIFVTGIGDDVCGVNVFTFNPVPGLSLGDTVRVSGLVEEYAATYGSTTELTFSNLDDINVRHSEEVPQPEIMPTGEVGREEHEGKLVRVSGRVVGKEGARELTIDDGSGPIIVWDQSGLFGSDPNWQDLFFGDEVSVTGIVSQRDPTPPYLQDYRIWPRSPEPPYQDVVVPQCIPDLTTSRAVLEITDGNGERASIFCPECSGPHNKVFIKFNGPHMGRTKLRVFDASGRCVATLEDHVTVCGAALFEWDGRNELLEALPMGLYHVVVTATDPSTGSQTQETLPVVIGRRLK
jgi:hypothetical protein